MELLLLALVALALCFTVFLVFLKLLWLGARLALGFLLLSLKLLGIVGGGVAELLLLPFKLALVVLVVGALLMALVVFPIVLPLLVLAGVVFLGVRLVAA